MGLLDKIMGRTKKAAGDLAGDPSLRREGAQEERKGEAKDELANAHERPRKWPIWSARPAESGRGRGVD
jgi:uncharacterized protein YjbJ (UPF0337 family)